MPTDLTSDFVSILEGDLRHPQIQYYENEKKNAIAPKITSKAKTAVQEEINSTVIETVANAVTTANSVFNALGLDAQDVAQRLTVHLEDASASMAQLSATLQSLQSLSDQAGNLIGCARDRHRRRRQRPPVRPEHHRLSLAAPARKRGADGGD